MANWMAGAALGPVLNGMLAGVALAAGVWLLLHLLPRTNATTRYAVWSATLLATVCLPLLMMEAPAGAGRGTAGGAAAPLITLPAPGQWLLWALAAWLAIGLALLARLGWSYGSLRRLKHNARPLPDQIEAEFEELLKACPGWRYVRIRASSEIGVPVAAGLFNPVILIPESLPEQLSEGEFRQVLVHELAHIRRWDDWTNLAQKLAEAVFFFHPAVPWIARRLNLEREIACDDWVVSMTGAARPYAACLTRLVELGAFPRGPQLVHGVVARRRQISHRIESLLSRKRAGSPRLSKFGVLASSGALALAALLAGHLAPIAVAEPAMAASLAGTTPIAAVRMAYAVPPRVPRPVMRRVAVAPRTETVRYMVIQEWTCVVYYGGAQQTSRWVTILWTHPAPVHASPGRT